ncbi:MAG TPA: nitrite reductase large subunit NirB [Polyangiaceae bacterium]|nr:nitrite reductase large subunit NirB [Polyangiaceae bacterium]
MPRSPSSVQGGVATQERPLLGATLAVPAMAEVEPLAEILTRAGAVVTRFSPVAASDDRAIERWLSALVEGEFDDVVFWTAQGVRLVCEIARQLGREPAVFDALRGTRIFAQGGRTARALSEFGLTAAVRAGTKPGSTMLDVVRKLEVEGRVVGLQPRDTGDREPFVDELERRGATVRVAGRFVEPDTGVRHLLVDLVDGGVSGIVFYGASQVTWLWDGALATGNTVALASTLGKISVVATDSAAEALRDRGIRASSVPLFFFSGGAKPEDVRALFAVTPKSEPRSDRPSGKKRLVVVGHGVVSHAFCENLFDGDSAGEYRVTVIGEEPLPAYDRVRLTSYFDTRDPKDLELADPAVYEERGARLRLATKVARIDRQRRVVVTTDNDVVPYDVLVLATGSSPFVPPVPGMEKPGVFVYRTIQDLEALLSYSRGAKSAAVIGGGLLGLEAAKAVKELGLETHVVEFAPRLMPRQLDAGGADVLLRKITELDVTVHLGKATARVHGTERAQGLRFADGSRLDVDMIIVSAGIRPRDELARDSGIEVGERGGIVVGDTLRTSDPYVYAIGECALHRGVIYGLAGPGREMARALADHLVSGTGSFTGGDTSTKLKLLGVDVASIGDPFADALSGRAIVFSDLVRGVYKKMALSADGKLLLGAVLVGDAAQYGALLHAAKSGCPLSAAPEELLLGTRLASTGTDLPGTAQVCSCNDVTKDELCAAIRDEGASTVADLRRCTRATSGCGGCAPLVADVLRAELEALGKAQKPRLCEHFAFTRAELFQIVKVTRVKTFDALLASHGKGNGCEICKPAVASILASIHNDPILDQETLQDTNDRFLANIQRGGTYSVVPRIPGGEITPEKLRKIGDVAERFSLYTKITGGQRIDLLGARLSDLPDIWEALVDAGFESGHAYGKAVRTVKSCVGSTWCRYGVQDSVAFAIRIEERYKGIRAPHKLKSAVSGCVRECAEAQSKDFGLIATEKGWNLFVCGNGGAKPRHADLLAQDVDEATAIRYLDRFLMFYIQTADRLTRTSVWLEKLEGGIEHLKDVVVRDSLGIAASLEADMQALVDGYQCEWKLLVKDPVRRARFREFASGTRREDTLPMVSERGQSRPRDWPQDGVIVPRRPGPREWVRVAKEADFPKDGGMAVVHGSLEVAVFAFSSRGEWYAVQNRCPHRGDPVLARGIIGDEKGTPKVACPFHKKTFSLADGRCLSGDAADIESYSVQVRDGWVWVELPREERTELVPPSRLVRRPEEASSPMPGE